MNYLMGKRGISSTWLREFAPSLPKVARAHARIPSQEVPTHCTVACGEVIKSAD